MLARMVRPVEVIADAFELPEQRFLFVYDHDPLAETAGGDIVAHGHPGFRRQRLDSGTVLGGHAGAEFDVFVHVFLRFFS